MSCGELKLILQNAERTCAVDDGKEDAKDVIRTGGEKRYRWLQRATT
jgi:hypothetical protein